MCRREENGNNKLTEWREERTHGLKGRVKGHEGFGYEDPVSELPGGGVGHKGTYLLSIKNIM